MQRNFGMPLESNGKTVMTELNKVQLINYESYMSTLLTLN